MYSTAVLASLISSWITYVNASPTQLVPRLLADIAKDVAQAIQAGTGGRDNDARAWTPDKVPDLCSVVMRTHAGGGCKMIVKCKEGGIKTYNNFIVCEVGKRQYWHDDRIGDFSIMYSQAGGVNSDIDGLHAPILQFKGINKWQDIAVNDLGQKNCNDATGCDDSKDVCYEASHKEDKEWGCGIPKLGKGSNTGGVGLSNDYERGKGGYAHGKCGIHIVQHQKDDPKKDPYKVEVWIKDANEDDIGEKYPAVKMNGPLLVDSKLPEAVKFETGAVDKDPITITYKRSKWTPDMGKYDGGKREGDTNFPCK